MHAGCVHVGVGTFRLGFGQISQKVDAGNGYGAGTIREAFLEHVHVAGQALPRTAQVLLRAQTEIAFVNALVAVARFEFQTTVLSTGCRISHTVRQISRATSGRHSARLGLNTCWTIRR